MRAHYIKEPTAAHPLVRELFRLMNHERIGFADVAERAGIKRPALSNWRTRCSPSLTNFIAVLNVVGYDLKIVRIKDQ